METIQEYVHDHHSAPRSHLGYTCNVIVFPSVSAALDRPYSYVIVATKALPEISPTSKLLSPFLSPSYPHPQPAYVLLQNGIGIEHDLYNALLADAEVQPKNWNLQGRQADAWKTLGPVPCPFSTRSLTTLPGYIPSDTTYPGGANTKQVSRTLEARNPLNPTMMD